MRCPKCVEEDKKHEVRSWGGSKTLMMGKGEFWDENDERHHHDPNTVTVTYSCSNGHRWSTKEVRRCPCPGCDHGSDPKVISPSWRKI